MDDKRDTFIPCYVTACNNAAHVCGYNRVTHGMYCAECMLNMQRFDQTQPQRANLFPLFKYRHDVPEGGGIRRGLMIARFKKIKVPREWPGVPCTSCTPVGTKGKWVTTPNAIPSNSLKFPAEKQGNRAERRRKKAEEKRNGK